MIQMQGKTQISPILHKRTSNLDKLVISSCRLFIQISLYIQLKCALNMHLICTIEPNMMLLFFIFLVLKLHTKCVPNSTFGGCSCALTFLNYVAKFEPNLILICPKQHCRKLVQIRCYKGACWQYNSHMFSWV